jgi:hypothetical protein
MYSQFGDTTLASALASASWDPDDTLAVSKQDSSVAVFPVNPDRAGKGSRLVCFALDGQVQVHGSFPGRFA